MVKKDKEIIKRLNRRFNRTPDFAELRLFRKFPLFVYGNEMKGEHLHHLLEGAEYLGRSHTLNLRFNVKEYQNTHPIAFRTKANSSEMMGSIRGELYNVCVEHIFQLDWQYLNGLMSERIIDRVFMEDQTVEEAPFLKYHGLNWVHAFLYVGNREYYKAEPQDLKEHYTRANYKRHYNDPTRYFQWKRDLADDKTHKPEYTHNFLDVPSHRGPHGHGFSLWDHGEVDMMGTPLTSREELDADMMLQAEWERNYGRGFSGFSD